MLFTVKLVLGFYCHASLFALKSCPRVHVIDEPITQEHGILSILLMLSHFSPSTNTEYKVRGTHCWDSADARGYEVHIEKSYKQVYFNALLIKSHIGNSGGNQLWASPELPM